MTLVGMIKVEPRKEWSKIDISALLPLFHLNHTSEGRIKLLLLKNIAQECSL